MFPFFRHVSFQRQFRDIRIHFSSFIQGVFTEESDPYPKHLNLPLPVFLHARSQLI